MSPFRLILASLAYHWRIHLAVALGVAAGAAVLTGALLVGDSMRGSLRDLTLQRLGRIDEALVAHRFFRQELADELAAQLGFSEHFSAAVPGILLEVSLENPNAERPAQAGHVNLIGADPQFWALFPKTPVTLPEGREIVLNQPLAEQLGVAVGDVVILRLPRLTSIPPDSALGRKTDTVTSHRMTVRQIIPATGPGRFDLRASQQLPRNALVSLDWLAERLDRPQEANLLLVAGHSPDRPPPPEASRLLQRLLKPSLADFGIRAKRTPQGYLDITSDRMLLEPAADRAIREALTGQTVQPALTYLANTIACGDREIPYSTITAVDFTAAPPLGPLVTPEGTPIKRLARDEIVLNTWAADELQAKPGDMIRVTYFEPESTGGEIREKTTEFRLAAITPLSGPAADPAFTPEVPGVTDQAAIADWDPPFPFDAKRIRPQDEKYWDDHRATPKAFVAYSTGVSLWGNRFGETTSLRVVPPEERAGQARRLNGEVVIEDALARDAAELGFWFQPVKRQGLAAAAGTTPFGVLFLGLSFFIITAAVMLVALLFRLGVQMRASEIGVLLALGLGQRRVSRLLALEGLAVAALGSLLGTVLGIGYAALMITGLKTLWLAAIVTPFLRLHVTPLSLTIGYLSGVAVAFAAVAWTVRQLGQTPPRRLLAGLTTTPPSLTKRTRASRLLAGGFFLAALAMSLAGLAMSEEIRAVAFFGAGALMLAAGLATVRARLRSGATGPAVALGRGNLARLALRNAAQNPGRSTLTIGAIASAAFLIVAMSAFQRDPATEKPAIPSGNGGFALLAETDRPLYHDPGTPHGQSELGFSPDDAQAMQGATIFSFRVKPGDDASCLNLYQPRQPRILGVPATLDLRQRFAFSDYREVDVPQKDPDGTPRVAAIVDEATAKYALHLWRGVGETLEVVDGRGRPLRLEIVALLKNSIFQGDVLIGERAFRQYFPDVGGYRYFLVQTPPAQQAAVAQVLQQVLGDYGFSSETTATRLARLLAVQNTYLSTFQTLGALGLLLGTFGLAAVQLRSVLERRRELALLRAVGFRRRTLAGLVLLENAALLLAGLGAGILAAAVAVLPHFLTGTAAIPWGALASMLSAVLAAGLLAGAATVRTVLGALVPEALRGE